MHDIRLLTFHCKLRLFLVLLISFGAAGQSGSQLSVVKLTNSKMDSFMELLVAETLKKRTISYVIIASAPENLRKELSALKTH